MPDKLIPKYRRKQYFVAKKFQTKYVGLFLAFMVVTGVLCAYAIYYNMMVLMGEKLANVYPQGRLIDIINMVNIRASLGLLLIAPFVVIISIFLSHKIAGPMYRMEKFLTSMGGGDLSGHITLRKGDELKTLAERINFVVGSLRLILKDEVRKVDLIANGVESLRRMVDGGAPDKLALAREVEKLAGDIKALEADIKKFKL